MEIFVETPSLISEKTKARLWTVAQVLLGSLFIAACAQITIPLYPVPLTMHTFGVFILAIMQGGKKASWSTLAYLALVSLGLPVLSGMHVEPMWFALHSAGYLMAFPLAAFVIGKLTHLKERPSALWVMGSIAVGQMIIYTAGVLGLMRFLDLHHSFMVGVVPFLPLAGVKVLMAASLGGLWLRWKKK